MALRGQVRLLQLLAACVYLLPTQGVFEGCRIRYGRRGCTDRVHEGVIVTCDGNSIMTELPGTIPEDTVYISLVNFKFGTLRRANFTDMRKVECIHILDSGIKSIDYDTFTDMEVLNEMEFRNTNLSTVDVQFINHPEFRARLVSISGSDHIRDLGFNGTAALQKLKEFHVEDNNIRYVAPSILSNLITVEKLSLSNNELDSLDWNRLSYLSKLNNLALDGNNIQSIPDNVQEIFAAVKELHLAGNPLHCNCKLRWLKEFYDATTDKLLDYEDVRCASPFQKRMIDTFADDFSCDKPSAPTVEWKTLTPEHEYIVNCSSESDPAPTLTLTLPDGKVVHSPPAGDISQLATLSARIVVGPGAVYCEASNSEGVSVTVEHIPYEGFREYTQHLRKINKPRCIRAGPEPNRCCKHRPASCPGLAWFLTWIRHPGAMIGIDRCVRTGRTPLRQKPVPN